MIEKNELKYWLAWNRVKEIGPIRFINLIKHFSSLEEAWNKSPELKNITEILHIGQDTWLRIKSAKLKIDPDKELVFLDKWKVKVITIKDEGYPPLLKNIYDPPPIIYYRGNFIEMMGSKKAIAIVGSRKATYYGKKIAREIALELGSRKYIVISGLARGIDTNAHLGALDAEGETIAVLGCGLDRIYPAENKQLAAQISKTGALISEFPVYTKPERGNFPRRNRLISGLSDGVVVVEAAAKSGALITADFALEQGREVFAVPGNIHSFLSNGCHNLIKQGAKLVNGYKDIIEEIEENNHFFENNNDSEKKCDEEIEKKLSDCEKKFLTYISTEPLHIDKITELTDLPLSKVNEILLTLELKNIIREIEGKRYIRI